LSYQGYDANEGAADIRSLLGDVEAFYLFCRERFPGQHIGLVAESLSTAPFLCFASLHPEVSALVLEAVINLKTIALAKVNECWPLYPIYPLGLCVALIVSVGVPDNLSFRQALGHHSVIPALFIHHPEDKVTPYRSAHRIFERYYGPKEWITLQTEHSKEFHMTASDDLEVRGRVIDFLENQLKY
jgi:hypothetical protein